MNNHSRTLLIVTKVIYPTRDRHGDDLYSADGEPGEIYQRSFGASAPPRRTPVENSKIQRLSEGIELGKADLQTNSALTSTQIIALPLLVVQAHQDLTKHETYLKFSHRCI